MKKLFTILALVFGVNAIAQNINISGNISANTTWSSSVIDTVKVVGDITIDSLVTLTIQPGIVVDFTGNYYLNVKGTLKAVGTAVDTIKFTTSNRTGYATNSHVGWGGIRIRDRIYSGDTTKISYCVIEYGKANGTNSLPDATSGGGLYVYQSFKIVLNNSTIRRNYAQADGGGLYDYYSFVNPSEAVKIKNCHFYDNKCGTSGGAVYTNRGIETFFENCVFGNNKATQQGGAIYVGTHTSSRLQAKNCRFSYNEADGAGAISAGGATGMIENCIINNNVALNGAGGGITVFQGNLNIKNCVVVNNQANHASNGYGGGIYFFNVVSDFNGVNAIVNNTIANNLATYGGGIYVYDTYSTGFDLYINKTIFFNNVSTDATNDDVYLYQISGSNQTRFYSCSFGGNLSNTTGNPNNQGSILNTDPMFASPSASAGAAYEGYVGRNWSLNYCSSPCIDPPSDAIGCTCFPATDISGNPRKLNNTVDIGAYEHEGIISQPAANASVCAGDVATFTLTTHLSSTYTVLWEHSTNNGSSFQSNLTQTGNTFNYPTNANDNGTLVKATIAYGCRTLTTTMATITVYALPNVTVSANQNTVCVNENIQLTAQGATTYTWNGSSTGNTHTTSALTTTGNVTYSVALQSKNNNGCLSSNTVITSVTVNPLPNVIASATANQYSVCLNESIQITFTAQGATTYTWISNTTPSANITSPYTASVAFTNTGSTVYNNVQVKGTDNNGCVSAYTVITTTITVNPLPTLTASINEYSVCTGDTIHITVQGANTYSYGGGGAPLSGNTFTSVVTNYVGNNIHTYNFSLDGTDNNGCVSYNTPITTTVIHNPRPNVFITQQNFSICENESIQLTAGAGGNAVVTSYTWNNNSTLTGNTHTSPTFTTDSWYSIALQGTDNNGCVSNTYTADIYVTVNVLPTLTVTGTSLICAGTTATLSADGAWTYTWSTGETIALFGNIFVSPTITTTYSVQGEGNFGCIGVADFVVEVNECLGINEIERENYPSVRVYPNPSNGEFFFTGNFESGTQVIITNVIEQQVLISELSNTTNAVHIQDVKGIYFYSIILNNKHIATGKLIVD